MGKIIDITGMTFGKLKVLGPDPQKGRYLKWICECECGNFISVNGANLRSGNTKSCGCLKSKGIVDYNATQSEKAIIPNGTRFGKLIVIDDLGLREQVPGHRRRWYRCLCDCGQEKEVMGNQLKTGNTASCGKCNYNSHGEFLIAQLLDENNILYERDKSFLELSQETGRNLRFDFIIYNKDHSVNRFVEFDGRQHYFGPEASWSNCDNLETIQERDTIKNNFCYSHGYTLIRIPYKEIQNITLDSIFGDKFMYKKEGGQNGGDK